MSEKTDPLKRIQDEINEVARREEEYRRKLRTVNGNKMNHTDQDDNRSETPLSLSSMNSRESLDDNHSDDSGILSSISPMSDSMISSTPSIINEKDKYIRPKYYSTVSVTSAALSNPIPTKPAAPRIFKPINTGQKSLMEKFIASRGKLNLNQNQKTNGLILSPKMDVNSNLNSMTLNRQPPPPVDILPAMIPAVVERDEHGKPLRRGFVPVEIKIRKELNEMKSRENELKRYRKLTNSTPDLLDALENEFSDYEEDENLNNVEHCLGPQKFKEAKLCSDDKWESNRNISLNVKPNGLKPALSLAQLCDIDPEESVSPRCLIDRFERLIQDNA